MASFTPFGPGTVTVGATGTELDFSGEVLGGKVTHTYEDSGEARTMLNGDVRPASKNRTDGLTFNLENDLTSAGLYAWLITNDLTEQDFAYTPNTPGAASWAGTIQVTLPADIGADEYGTPIISSVEWAGVGAFTFTPATASPLASAAAA